MKKILNVLACLLLFNCGINAQTEYKPAAFSDPGRAKKIESTYKVIDKLFENYAEKSHLPGAAYGIVVDGKLAHTGNFGYTDIEKSIPVTSNSLFRIASMSKSFTAMAILKLRDDGKLNLDDPISKFIPEFKNIKPLTTDAPAITVRHLLTHGAGFPEDNPWGDRQLGDSDRELMDFLRKQISFSNPPGIEFEYSNLGFALLGKIITVASGQRYQEYIREHIWSPLGMHSAEWEYSNVDPNKLAHGYRWLNEQWNEEKLLNDAPDGSWGAMGSMICSVNEFASYMALHLSAWPPRNDKDNGPLQRSSVREMHHPWRFNGMNLNLKYPNGRTCAAVSAYNYGLGWVKDCDGKIYIGHSGGLPGFGSQWRIMPDYGIGIVSLANRTYAPMGTINMTILDTIVKLAGLQPRQLPPSNIFVQRANDLMTVFPDWKKLKEGTLFAENFFADNPIDTLRKEFTTLYEKAGKIKGIKSFSAENQLRGSFIIEGEALDIEVYFTLSPENPPLVQELRVREAPGKK